MLSNTLFPPIVKGGAERSVAFLAKGLASRGHEVAILTMSADNTETCAREEGLTIYRLPMRAPYWPFEDEPVSIFNKLLFHLADNQNPMMGASISRALAAFKPDVLHSNIMTVLTPTLWREAKHVGIPVLHNLRDYWVLCTRSGFFPGNEACNRSCLECQLLTWRRRALTALVDGVASVSQYTLDQHIQAGLFPNAHVRKAILSAHGDGVFLRDRNTKADRPLTLGFLGRMKPAKGVHILVEALSQVPDELEIKLIIAGDGSEDYLERLKSLAPTGRVEFWGWRNPQEVYDVIDIVAIPSLYPEPLPRTAIEAYNNHLPVISARSGGLPEVVEEGITGWTYEPYDIKGLADILSRLASSRPDINIEPGVFEKYIARSNPDFVANQYEECYEQLIAKAIP